MKKMNVVKFRNMAGILIVGMILLNMITTNNQVWASPPVRIEDIPLGSIVYDPSWTWQHRTGDNYTGPGEEKPVEWEIVAKDHYAINQVTLITKEVQGMCLTKIIPLVGGLDMNALLLNPSPTV